MGCVFQADLVQMIVVPDPTAVSDQCTVFRIAVLDTEIVKTKIRSVHYFNIFVQYIARVLEINWPLFKYSLDLVEANPRYYHRHHYINTVHGRTYLFFDRTISIMNGGGRVKSG